MKRTIGSVLFVLMLTAALLLCSCSFFNISLDDLHFDNSSVTEYTPTTNADGKMLWPAELLPSSFPVLCEYADYISTDGSGGHDIVVCVTSPTWEQYYSFVMTLADSGWGSIEDAYIRAYYEERPDSYLGLAEGMRKMYDDPSREQTPVFYSGFCDSYHVWCSMDAADSDSEYRFVLYLDQNSNSTHGRFRSTVLSRYVSGKLSPLKTWDFSAKVEGYDIFTYKYDESTKYTVSTLDVDKEPTVVVDTYLEVVENATPQARFSFKDAERLGAGAIFEVSDANQTLSCAYYAVENEDGEIMQIVLTATPHNFKASMKEISTVFGFEEITTLD